jgi:molecular chaperone GrpE
MTTRRPDIAEALHRVRVAAEEGAPQGASEPSVPAPEPSVPASKPSVPAPEPSVPAGEPGAPAGRAATTNDQALDATKHARRAKLDHHHKASVEHDHEPSLEHDVEELAAKAEKADEYLELAKRTRADFDNYRKRATRDAAAAQERGIAKLAKELLPAVDNLDRALEAAASASTDGAPHDNSTATLVSGIKLVHEDVIAALARAGIERFSPEGEPFDPQLHEAIAQLPVEGAESGTVVEVYQRGYRLGEFVIRPARVVVAA